MSTNGGRPSGAEWCYRGCTTDCVIFVYGVQKQDDALKRSGHESLCPKSVQALSGGSKIYHIIIINVAIAQVRIS